jgi:hypothetical protein
LLHRTSVLNSSLFPSGGPNKDPGSAPGAYGGYKPASASTYKPPKGWKPNKGDTCFKNGLDLLPKQDLSKPGQGSGHLNRLKDEDSTIDPKQKNADKKNKNDNNSTTKPKNYQQDSSTTDSNNNKDGSSTKTTKSSSSPKHRKKSLRKKCT